MGDILWKHWVYYSLPCTLEAKVHLVLADAMGGGDFKNSELSLYFILPDILVSQIVIYYSYRDHYL